MLIKPHPHIHTWAVVLIDRETGDIEELVWTDRSRAEVRKFLRGWYKSDTAKYLPKAVSRRMAVV